MSSIIYSGFVREDTEDGVVIDSNDLFREKVADAARREEASDAGTAPVTEERQVLDADGNPVLDENGNPVTEEVPVPQTPDLSVSGDEILKEANEKADAIIADAEQKAENITSSASAEAAAMKEQAASEGKQEGYTDGLRQAEEELKKKQAALSEEEAAMKRELKQQSDDLEEKLVDVILDVAGHVFGAELSGTKEMILHLVSNTIENIDASGQFQIRASAHNADILEEHKAELEEKCGPGAEIYIIRDPLFDDTKVTIETDGGIFDCSFDVEFDALSRAIRALSMKKTDA